MDPQSVGAKKILTVLAVEDDTFSVSLVKRRLDDLGLAVITAETGKEGVERAKKDHPDLILLDIMLPDMDGFSVMEMLNKDPSTQSIPVVVLSNFSDKESIERGFSCGARQYLVKSAVLPAEVARIVHETVNWVVQHKTKGTSN